MKKETLYEMVGYADDDLLQRSEQHLVRHIGKAARFGGRSVLPFAAAVAVFLVSAVTVVAVVLYTQRVEEVTEPLQQTIIMEEPDGNEKEIEWVHDGPGMVFSWEGASPETERFMPQFKREYTSEKLSSSSEKKGNADRAVIITGEGDPTQSWRRQELWDKGDGGIPLKIDVFYPLNNVKYVLAGECEIVFEEEWDSLLATGVHVKHPNGLWTNGIGYEEGQGGINEENHVLIFDTVNGYVIQVAGTMEMEEIERTARNLVIRISDQPFEWDPVMLEFYETSDPEKPSYGYINLGRG